MLHAMSSSTVASHGCGGALLAGTSEMRRTKPQGGAHLSSRGGITHQPQPADNDAVLETADCAHHVHSTVCKAGGALYGCATEPSPISVHISRCEPLCRGRLCCCWWTNGLWRGVVAPRPPHHPLRPTPLPWPSIRHLPLLTFELLDWRRHSRSGCWRSLVEPEGKSLITRTAQLF